MYCRPKKTNDTVVQLQSGRFAEIKNFIYKNNEVFAKVEILHVKVESHSLNVKHIFSVTRSDTIEVVPIQDIKEKSLHMNIGSCEFISILPNVFEIQ